jgi:NAD(P)-dependent dehydrogenase (short-subunit alcohol dehydrogenase family)
MKASSTMHESAWKGKIVLITGGSRGLGLELARLWARCGARVGICARTADDLHSAIEELQHISDDVFAQPCDVTLKSQVQEFVESARSRWGTIHAIVNNAGIIQAGPVECMTIDDYRQAMDTHFWGPLHMIEAALPDLKQNQGHIVNIASIGGKISVPHMLPYCASKFALVGLSEGLRAEFSLAGVKVTTVCPGLMRTGSPRNAWFKGKHRAEYAWFNISDSLPLLSINSERAAQKIIHAAARGQAYVSLSVPAKIGIRLHGLFPGITARVLSFINRFLPAPGGIGKQMLDGANSTSKWSPSKWTRLSDEAALRNNEMRD